MQDRLRDMKDPIVCPVRLETEFLISCYHTPSETVRRIFNVVLRAGHLRAASDYRIERRHLPGHDLLFCLSGNGIISSANRRYQVRENELAWISGYRPHAHWTNPDAPWELLWMRIDGSQLEQTWNILSGDRAPVFSGLDRQRIMAPFQRILQLMTQRPLAIDALLNAQVAEILSQLFEARQVETSESLRHLPMVSPELKAALMKMALYPDRQWRVADLARLSGLSQPHFYRRFKLVTGHHRSTGSDENGLITRDDVCSKATTRLNRSRSKSVIMIHFSSAAILSDTPACLRRSIEGNN